MVSIPEIKKEIATAILLIGFIVALAGASQCREVVTAQFFGRVLTRTECPNEILGVGMVLFMIGLIATFAAYWHDKRRALVTSLGFLVGGFLAAGVGASVQQASGGGMGIGGVLAGLGAFSGFTGGIAALVLFFTTREGGKKDNPVSPPHGVPEPQTDYATMLKELSELKVQGLLTEAEFLTKKEELLRKI